MSVIRVPNLDAPTNELATVRNRLRRFFDEPFGFDLRLPLEPARRLDGMLWSPMVEAVEHPTEYVLTVELPGISRENIEISVVDGVLTLRGTKEEEKRSEDKERMFHLWEREYGKFERTFRFPLEVQDAKVTADFANGVLKVCVPKVKVEQPAARMVPIVAK